MHRSVMVQMPTGTGKTVLLSETIRRFMAHESLSASGVGGGGVLIVAHRRELVGQISQTLGRFGVPHGLIVSGKEIDYAQVVQVASIQTLARRIDTIHGPQPKKRGRLSAADMEARLNTLDFSLIIIDEAHHALAETYRMLWEKWPEARFLGLTATPCRLNNAPFTDLFETLLQAWPIQEFIDKGWLSDFEYVSASPNSEAMKRVRSLKRRGTDGDYQKRELVTVMDVPESIEHLYNTYKKFADGKKGIVYAIDRQHAQHITAYYRMHGVRCAIIESKTSAEKRRELVEAYRIQATPPTLSTSNAHNHTNPIGQPSLEGRGMEEAQCIDVLVNVDVFSEGFDAPEVEFIQLARPTLSLSKYLQQVGRGMRISPDKPHVLILDNVGLYQTFGLPTEERDWRQTFYGMASGRGDATGSRYVVMDERGDADPLQRELVNLEMVRIKKGGKKRAGLEIFLKDGRYGVMNNGKVSCQSRFKEIVRLHDKGGFFAAGIYSGMLYDHYVEYASLIDWKGIDRELKLFRDVEWRNGIYYSSYKPRGYREGGDFWDVYWDPKGNCYYDNDPGFRMVAGVEVACASEHIDRHLLCYKLRYSTGNLSPRFYLSDIYYNKHVIIARDYLVVKNDKNHAYHICGYLEHSIIVRKEDMSGYQEIGLDGRKGESFRSLPQGIKRISPISYLYYMKELKLQRL